MDILQFSGCISLQCLIFLQALLISLHCKGMCLFHCLRIFQLRLIGLSELFDLGRLFFQLCTFLFQCFSSGTGCFTLYFQLFHVHAGCIFPDFDLLKDCCSFIQNGITATPLILKLHQRSLCSFQLFFKSVYPLS